MPSCGDYIMHFLTLPWKLVFAFIPPTGNFYHSLFEQIVHNDVDLQFYKLFQWEELVVVHFFNVFLIDFIGIGIG